MSQSSGHDWLVVDFNGTIMTDLHGSGRGAKGLYSHTVIADGQLHRVALTWGEVKRKLYVDGVMVAEDEPTFPPDVSESLYIGCGADRSPETFFSGLIDDICIYNRAVRP